MNHTYQINPDWKRVANQIVKPNQCVLVIGASDSGKSTFCRYLIDFAWTAQLKVALVDADVGQSQIGPPTTIGMKLFDGTQADTEACLPFGGHKNKLATVQENRNIGSEKMEGVEEHQGGEIHHAADALYFFGSLSPSRNLLPVLTGTRLMVEAGLAANADFIVIDTTGYVQEGPAVLLKQQKIDLIRPNHVVCIGRSKDLDRIVGCYSNFSWLTIHYLLPHKQTRTKSSAARKRIRKSRFERYFSKSELQKISFEQIRGTRTPFFNGRIANQRELEILTRLAETEIDYAEWGHRSVILVTRRNLPQNATKNIKNYLSLLYVSAEKPVYFAQRLVGMLNAAGDTLAIGTIESVDFQNQELNIRCKPGIASQIKVLQFGDYQFTTK